MTRIQTASRCSIPCSVHFSRPGEALPAFRGKRLSGLTLVEVLVAVFIAGGAAIFILSLGQANQQLSRIGRESIIARQIATDFVEYFSENIPEAKTLMETTQDFREVLETHLAFKDALAVSESTRETFKKMNPQIYARLQTNLSVPPDSGQIMPGLHRMIVIVAWKENPDKDIWRRVMVSRIVGDIH